MNELMAEVGVTSNEQASTKAHDLFRLSELKFPPGSNPKLDVSRMLITLEIALKLLRIPYATSNFVDANAKRGIKKSDYIKAFNTLKNVLGLKFEQMSSTLELLSIRFDESPKYSAMQILEKYKSQYVAKLVDAKVKLLDLTSPTYQAVAYFIAAKELKV